MPGPMVAWARSTGAIALEVSRARAGGSSFRRVAMNSRRVAIGASSGRGRHAKTIEEDRALVPISIMRPVRSVCIGHVPVTRNPACRSPRSIVSQPVETAGKPLAASSPSDSACLKA